MRPLSDWIGSLFAEGSVPKKILFRTDAGRIRGLSFGHAARCLALARASRAAFGAECLFLMRPHAEGQAFVSQFGWEVWPLPVDSGAAGEAKATRLALERIKPDWLVIDLPYPDCLPPLPRRPKTWVLFIDDARFACPKGVDVYLNSSLLAPQRLKAVLDPRVRCLLGPDHFIFDEALLSDPPLRSDGLMNVLVTAGGSDPTGLTLKVLEALRAQRWPGVLFRIILGPGFTETEEAANLIRGRAREFELVNCPDNLMPYLRGCDLAVCAGGRTMYELVYLKKNFLPLATAAHEKEAVRAFVQAGLTGSDLVEWRRDAFIKELNKLITGTGREARGPV